jgi:hypothetical protein
MPPLKLSLKLNALEINWVKITNTLRTSNTDKMIAVIIQPRLRRGLGGGGGAMIGGGVNSGGIVPEENGVVSMTRAP